MNQRNCKCSDVDLKREERDEFMADAVFAVMFAAWALGMGALAVLAIETICMGLASAGFFG